MYVFKNNCIILKVPGSGFQIKENIFHQGDLQHSCMCIYSSRCPELVASREVSGRILGNVAL